MPKQGRPSELDRRGSAFIEQVADLYVAGLTRQQIADNLGAGDVKTITRWVRDERTQKLIQAKTRDRANRILRTVDTALMAKLENPEERKKMPLKDLLDIRRTVAPTVVEVGRVGDQAAEDAAAWMASDQRGEAVDVDFEEDGPLELPPGFEADE